MSYDTTISSKLIFESVKLSKTILSATNLHHTDCISSCSFTSCSFASPWSRESQILLRCQHRSAPDSSSPPRHMVVFRHRTIFAQLVLGLWQITVIHHLNCVVIDTCASLIHFTGGIHYQVVILMHVSRDAPVFR